MAVWDLKILIFWGYMFLLADQFVKMDRWFGAASAVMQALCQTVVVKRELSQKAKFLIYCFIYVPTLTYGHELWVVNEGMRSQIQAAEMSFLCAENLRVNYPHSVCAMNGSTVTLPCTFKTLEFVIENGQTVSIEIRRVVWCPNHEICQGSTPSVYDSESKSNHPHYRYLGDKKGNCTLQITNVQKEDNATFRFRVETNRKSATFTGQSGVIVTVDFTPMKIETERDREFKRGDKLTLSCTAACPFHQLGVTWFRDGDALPETGPTLQLGPLAAKDSGNYTCGLENNHHTLSQPYSLRVEAEDKAGGVSLSLIAGVVVGALLALFTLILVLCIIKRKRAAAANQNQPAEGGEVEQKHPDIIYSNILQPAEQQPQEDISYAAVQFKHKNQARPAEEAEVGVIYSSVASRG